LFLTGFSLPVFSASNEHLTVQVKQGQMRSSASFLGSVTATLAYGDKVTLVEDKGDWKKVTFRKSSGWMHTSALTTKTLVLQVGKSAVKSDATKTELSLAGKGFNSKVEAEFKSKNKDIDYTWVNRMEAQTVKPGQMQSFLKQGKIDVPREARP
jgi:hypothetical protein